MLKLIKKEFMLGLHPTMIIFLAFASFVFVPNYPYEVMFFFSTLSTFFMCINARENNDLFFACTLPVAKADVAKARILTVTIFQIAMVVLAAAMAALKSAFIPMPNVVSMDANAAFVGMGLIILGVFNITFFPMHYKNPNKVGMPFFVAGVIVFVIICVEIVLCQAVPFVRDKIDTFATEYIWYRIAVLIAGIVAYVLLTAASCMASARRLNRVDL